MIIIDTETSGLSPTANQIIQIAAFDEDTHDSFQRKLKFCISDANEQALKLNHYNEAVWNTAAVGQEQGRAEFIEFCREHAKTQKMGKSGKPYLVAQACAYNASFDKAFIDEWMLNQETGKKEFLPLDPKWTDPLQICMAFFPHLENHKLETVAKAMGIEVEGGAHDAMVDVLILANVVYKLRPAVSLAAKWCYDNFLNLKKPND